MSSSHDELRQYLDFDEADVIRLRRVLPVVEPHLGEIIGRFYDRIRAHPEAAAVFRNEAQIVRQAAALERWMRRFFDRSRDGAYLEETAKIGRVHVAVGLPQRYMLASMNVVRMALDDVVRTAGVPDEAATLASIHRGLDLELSVMVDSYFVAELARAEEAQRREVTHRSERLASIGILAAGLAHEIRNPLNGALLHLTFLRRRLNELLAEEVELAEAVDVVNVELKRLSNLVAEFLDFARPKALQLARVDLRDVATKAVEVVTAEANALGVGVRVDLPVRGLEAMTDRACLTQALINLLKNALEAAVMTAPGRVPQVIVRVREAGDDRVLEIEDNGVGIVDDKAPIFDPFFTTKPKGTGLGLSVAHRIVTDHEGTLTFASHAGRTIFTVKLPAATGSLESERNSH